MRPWRCCICRRFQSHGRREGSHRLVPHRTRRCGEHAQCYAEGEEGVGPQGHTGVLSDPSAFFFRGERRGTLGEELLPCTFGQYIAVIFRNVNVDRVVAVGAANAGGRRASPSPWDVGATTRCRLSYLQTGAVNAALLAGTNADGLTVFHIANGVRLCIFECDEGDGQIAHGRGGQLLVLRGALVEKVRIRKIHLVRPCSKVTPNTCLRSMGSGT